MTISDQIIRLNNAKAAITQSLRNKGVAVSDTALLDEYPALIDSIEVGSEGEGGGDPYYEELFNQRTSNGTNMSYLFNYSEASELNLSHFNTSNVTTMASMFSYCRKLKSLDISNFDTSNVTAMNNMFAECSQLQSLDLSGFDTGNVTTMDSMFSYMQNYSLPKIDLSSFTTKKLQQAYYMFYWCIAIQELDIRNFELVHEDGTEVAISGMLEGCNELHILRLDNCSKATVSKIINESGMPQEQAYVNGEYVTRKIYCKAEAAEGLSLPPGWAWEIVE